jgi:hypothetical protein
MKNLIYFLRDLHSTAPKERGKTLERWIFKKIEYLMVNSWKECSRTSDELTSMKHVKGNKSEGKGSSRRTTVSCKDLTMNFAQDHQPRRREVEHGFQEMGSCTGF